MPTPDELVARFTADFADLDAMIADERDAELRKLAEHYSAIAHGALYKLHEAIAASGGVVIASPIPKPQ